MKSLKRPDVWFALAVLLVALAGAGLLNNRVCKDLDERNWRHFKKLNAWQSAFDALSATCGVGLLTYDLDEEYTPRGRWVLTGLGVLGAMLYLAAGWQAARRLWSSWGENMPLPPVWLILLVFVALLGLSVPVVVGLESFAAAGEGWPEGAGWRGSTWRASAAFASLGWLPGSPPRRCTWIYAVVALVGGLGWLVWLLPVLRKRCSYAARVLALVGGYGAFLLMLATLIFALEASRGSREPAAEDAVLTGQPPGARYSRSLVQTVCASAAGIPTEQIADRNVTEGTKIALATAMLVGPLGGSAGGGIQWALLIWALSGGWAACSAPGRATRPAAGRCLLAFTTHLSLLALLAVLVAFGLLIIENRTASLYQPPPTFADSFLDASSAVAGGNLSSGLVATVTARNLSSGIRQPVDLYQYGMAWLMLAMLFGRVLPLFVLCQAAARVAARK